jgi:hypothetical protein
MADILDHEINGAPVTVNIRGTERPLCYSMHNVIVYSQLTGDSLFVKASFEKIDLAKDPEKWMACLWAGLHELSPDKKTWVAPFTLAELGALVDFTNAGDVSVSMVRALAASMPKPKEKDPKAEAPSKVEQPKSPNSHGSMRAHEGVSASAD